VLLSVLLLIVNVDLNKDQCLVYLAFPREGEGEKHPFDCIGHVFAVLCVSIKKLSEPCCESDIFSDSSLFVVL
jgi:hypothetical protein